MESYDLSERVARLASSADLAQELPEALASADSDPSTSLTKSRILLERLLRSVAQFEGVALQGKPMVGNLLEEKALRRQLPVVTLAEMEYVNRVASSAGPHPGQADTAAAIRVLEHLCRAIEWYAYQYLISGLRDNFDVPFEPGERIVAYVSSGGTCRCAMANVITREYLKAVEPALRICPVSLALHKPSGDSMSPDAARVLREELGVEAAEHRTIRADERYFRRASLLLAMDEKLLEQLPATVNQRARLFAEFYGGREGIDDPFRKGVEAYRTCFRTIQPLIAGGIGTLEAWFRAH
jgi:protein-tyrosine-phosphatase